MAEAFFFSPLSSRGVQKEGNRKRGRGNGQMANAMAQVVDAVGLTSNPNASQKLFRNDLTIVLKAMT